MLAEKLKAEVIIKSPMGPIKVLADIALDTPGTCRGQAKLMGFSNEFAGGVVSQSETGDHVAFDISVKLPFGVLDVHLDADVAPDGAITGKALVPRRRPMTVTGRLI